MFRAWKVGTAFGIDLYIHWTFLLLPAYVLLSNWGRRGLVMAGFLLAVLAAVAGCIVLHELGHALMARYFGIGTRDITLYPIGGVARLERMSERPGEELLIALAGPAVNLVIAAGLTLIGGTALSLGALSGADLSPGGLSESLGFSFLSTLIIANLMLGGFNLLPAFPMDGGRVLRALLSWPLGRLQATEIAVVVGTVMAVLLGVAGFLWNPMLILIAVFVFFMGRQELAAVRHREALREAHDEREGEVVLDAEPVQPQQAGFTGVVWNGQPRGWIVWRDGRPVGFIGAPPE